MDPGQFGSILDPHVFRTRLWMSSSWIPVGQKFDSWAEDLDWEKYECSQFKWNNTLFMFQVHFCLFHKYDHPLKILQYQHPVGYEYQIITCNLIPKGSLRYFICWKLIRGQPKTNLYFLKSKFGYKYVKLTCSGGLDLSYQRVL